MNKSSNNLHSTAVFVLFLSSYSPLFFLLIVKQVSNNYTYFQWGGISIEGTMLMLSKFGLSAVLILITIVGLFGYYHTMRNIGDIAKNGTPVRVLDVKNKNSDSIGYIATYIIPFLFEDFAGWYECFAITFLLFIIYRIYINSSLILINPLLSFSYGLYDIEYLYNNKHYNALIITKNKNLLEDTNIKIYEIGQKMYFAINI